MMKKNIICIPFAHIDKYNSGLNVRGGGTVEIYLKNAAVACVSAKMHNPGCEVAFATNLTESDLPESFIDLLTQHNILILHIAYDTFVFPEDYLWSLAFYKLCVLKHLADMDCESICYLDTDVYIQGSFDQLWEECKQNIMLLDINHGLGTSDYRILMDELAQFFDGRRYITHYGGEFFAATTQNAKAFVAECLTIYNEMLVKRTMTTKGDEFILSIAAEKMRANVKNAGAYVYRFWTGTDFRLVSTCYKYNRVVVLHVPNEKELGMLKLYNRIYKSGKLPPDKVVWGVLRLSRQPLYYQIKRKIRILIRGK